MNLHNITNEPFPGYTRWTRNEYRRVNERQGHLLKLERNEEGTLMGLWAPSNKSEPEEHRVIWCYEYEEETDEMMERFNEKERGQEWYIANVHTIDYMEEHPDRRRRQQ